GKTVVTPDVHKRKVYLAGFGNNRIATAVHDDLYTRCLALEAGGQIVVLCSVDLIGLFYDDVLKIREQLKVQAPRVSHLIVASTHVHEGPDTLGLWGPDPLHTGIDEDYLDWLDSQIVGTAVRAANAIAPARVELSRDDHPLLGMLQSVDRPPIIKDPYLFVMRLTSLSSGAPIAVLVNWSDHPETLGGENTEITADYPHWICEYVENHLGGTAIFFSGSIGKVSTLGTQVPLPVPETGEIAQDNTWRKARLIGTMVGQLAERALKASEASAVVSILIRKSVLFLPLLNDHFRIALAAGVFSGRKPLYTDGKLDRSTVEKELTDTGRVRLATGKNLQTEVDYVQLRSSDRVAAEIVTIPGEIYPELTNGGITRYPGADYPDAAFEPGLRGHLKSRYQFIFGLGNDELGYLIPKAEWDDQPPWLLNRPQRWYGEINSAGPDVAGVVLRGLVELIDQR
ncbi:MAG TPA: hypothetical protein VNB49_11155, partial [Candidatus Dormibacteraeota bacterium]|nr:hypothetical protein [Candidatus Dormibacteraeota bacterium]